MSFFVPSLTFLQSVDVLGVHSEQQAFVMEHADEEVYVVGSVAAWIQSLGQREERLRVIGEVVDVENGFWVRDVVLLQVCVKTCSWSSENAEVQTWYTFKYLFKLRKSAPIWSWIRLTKHVYTVVTLNNIQ